MTEEEKQLENHPPITVDSPDVSEEQTTEATTAEARVSTDSGKDSASQSGAEVQTETASPIGEVDSSEELSEEAVDGEALVQLAEEVESLSAQLEERTNQYKRIAADFDNFRRRTQKEKEDLEQQVKRSTLSELLPVVDSFERARSQVKPQTDQEAAIHKSYQGVYKQLVDGLKRIGVAPMRPEGKPFDPNLHEAVLREPTDQYSEGTVVEELVRGYLLGDRVLRHAMVKVAAAPEPVATSENSLSNPEG
jgi:molecular chaperone GrpE